MTEVSNKNLLNPQRKMNDYRPLSVQEIALLERQGCRADDWNHVLVKEGFTPERLEDVRFFGQIRLGTFRRVFERDGGVLRQSGIRRAELHHVTVDDDCLIENIHGYIANYAIGRGVCLMDIGTMAVERETTFGLGTPVNVLSEASDYYQVLLHRKLTAQEFSLCPLLPPEERGILRQLAEEDARSFRSSKGYVGDEAVICHTRRLTNVYVGPGACIDSAEWVEDCFLDSSRTSPVCIGAGVICRRAVLQGGAEVLDGAKVSECLVGQAVHIGKGFSAEASLFFANSYMDNGEACAVCAGPFTVSHHKSTLLIGCVCSFLNAGSGTNMSNHMYKLGPLHHGTLERGCKTASGTHLVWGGRVGAFSMVMGKYDNHADLSSFPFSYVFHTDGRCSLVPGVNFATVGTYRDLRKWPLRDKRIDVSARLDTISTYDALNPAVICQVRRGRCLLERCLQEQGEACERYEAVPGVWVTAKALQRGLSLYRRMEQLFVARWVRSVEAWSESAATGGETPWHDLLGLLLPDFAFQTLCGDVGTGNVASAEALVRRFRDYARQYAEWVEQYIRATYSRTEVLEALEAMPDNLKWYYAAVLTDACKEKEQGGISLLPHFDKFAADLQNESTEALKKAKEKLSSLSGRGD